MDEGQCLKLRNVAAKWMSGMLSGWRSHLALDDDPDDDAIYNHQAVALTRDFRNELVAIAASNEIDFDQVMAVVRQEWSVLIRDHLMNHVISSNYGALEIGAIVESMVDHIQKRR